MSQGSEGAQDSVKSLAFPEHGQGRKMRCWVGGGSDGVSGVLARLRKFRNLKEP